MKMNEVEGQVSMYDLDIWSGKTFPEHSAVTKGRTSESSSKKSQKSKIKMPLFLDLRTTNGEQADAYWETDGASLGEFSMHSFGESPKEGVESLLSQILEDNPHPKYYLSETACLGIITRANRRGKKLPIMLETALIQKVAEGNEYGEKGIRDTIEILRKMRCEIGEEALKEWVQRSVVLVQQKDVLLGEMCESIEDSEDSNERIVVERDGEEDDGEGNVCDMLYNGEVGDTPQRPQPNEQFCRELDLLMQKLPHENAQKAVIMYCLRVACESEETVSKTLSAIPQGESSYTLKIRSGCEGGGKGALVQTEKSATLSTLQDQTLFQAVGCDMYNQDLTGDKSASIGVNYGLSTGRNGVIEVYDARGNGNGKTVCTITGDHCNRVTDYTPVIAIDQGGGKSQANVQENLSPTLTCTHGGEPAVCYSLDEKMGNTYCWEEQANTLAARDYKQPQAVCYKPKAVDCRNCTENDINNALQANSAHSLNGNNVVRVRYIVRRLTPLECERLQGYPDGWTDIGDWVDSNGKKCKTSDAARYKALGNSIALPPWKWVLKRICACYERDATMASLFDGIGGFPYLWEQLNGKGSCLWASEIEEFPIAVTKARIGGG